MIHPPRPKKNASLLKLFGFGNSRHSKSNNNDEALDASLMRNDRRRSSKKLFDGDQTEMLDAVYEYHSVDIHKLRKRFKKSHQFDAFLRKNQINIDNARTSNIIILGTSGSGKSKVWWNFLNYFRKSYLDSNSWGLSPKDFYYIITEKIMNISIDILNEYSYHRKKIENDEFKEEPPSTCLTKNDLMDEEEYKLELDDDDVKEGYDFFEDLISKLSKIQIAINQNVQIEEKKKLEGIKPNWDKIQELRNIEKEIKEFRPMMAPKILKLWKSKQLRRMFKFEYGLHSSRNLFYFIDNINKFVLQKQKAMKQLSNDNNGNNDESKDDTYQQYASMSNSNINNHRINKKVKWEWEWSFEEILRCQIRTTGVIEQSTNLGPNYENDIEKKFNLKVRLYDVGGAQNERKKWKYVLNTRDDKPDIDCIVFVVNLMSFYKKSWESDKNGLFQSLQLFECLLSHGDDEKHHEKYHVIKTKYDPNSFDINDLNADPLEMAKSISQEEYNICIDKQVKKAINNINTFFIIFTDTEGLKEILDSGISFKKCFNDYDGDNSIIDVQNFIENKFKKVIESANKRTYTKYEIQQIKRQNSTSSLMSDGSAAPPFMIRTGSLGSPRPNKNGLKRMKTVPHSMKMSPTPKNKVLAKMDDDDIDKKEDEFNDFNDIDLSMNGDIDLDPEPQMEGAKKLHCRFVSVIDHNQMKSVMNEIVKTSFMSKSALDPVIYSLIDDH